MFEKEPREPGDPIENYPSRISLFKRLFLGDRSLEVKEKLFYEQRKVEGFFRSNPGQEFHTFELYRELEMSPGALSPILRAWSTPTEEVVQPFLRRREDNEIGRIYYSYNPDDGGTMDDALADDPSGQEILAT